MDQIGGNLINTGVSESLFLKCFDREHFRDFG